MGSNGRRDSPAEERPRCTECQGLGPAGMFRVEKFTCSWCRWRVANGRFKEFAKPDYLEEGPMQNDDTAVATLETPAVDLTETETPLVEQPAANQDGDPTAAPKAKGKAPAGKDGPKAAGKPAPVAPKGKAPTKAAGKAPVGKAAAAAPKGKPAGKPASPLAPTAVPKPAKAPKDPNALRKPQVRLLEALVAAGKPLTKAELVKDAKVDPAWIMAFLGHPNEGYRKERVAKGYNDLVTLGFAKIQMVTDGDKEVATWKVTPEGRGALKKAQKAAE